MYYTYSRWDGSQDGLLDAAEVLDALSDDLMADGDLAAAVQRIVRWGMQPPSGQRVAGLQTLLQRLRAERQRDLERYNLDSVLEDIRSRVSEVVAAERDEIRRRLDEAAQQVPDDNLAKSLETVARRKQELLDQLPEDPAAAVASLSDYEFLSEQAREQFEALTEMLRRQVLESHFESLRESLQSFEDGGLDDLKEMLHELNELLRQRMDGSDPEVGSLRSHFGHLLPPGESLDEIASSLQGQARQMEALLDSMSPEMRASLEAMMQVVLRDDTIRDELASMADALRYILPPRESETPYPFSGEASLTLEEALQVMRRLRNLDALEGEMMQAQELGDPANIESPQVHDLLGEEAYTAIERLKQLTKVLEEAGYAERGAGTLELTASGTRKIGQRALRDIFRNLKRDAFGGHAITERGMGGDRSDETKPYEFGDAFLLDLNATVMNAVAREGRGSPVRVAVSDFEVFRTECLTQASTVLMLDMSRSMPLRGCFVAAKKVALALNSLIRTQYPRDTLHIIGFSDLARELQPETLHRITWGDYVYGTNMQHGFLLARRLLGRQKGGTKQIILITDGEPTAHFEGDRVHFAYPPTFRTFQETLREVKRCTTEGIVINTFMLERSHYLADFVNQMTRINRGRAFFATPERLGDYILVDFVTNRQTRL